MAVFFLEGFQVVNIFFPGRLPLPTKAKSIKALDHLRIEFSVFLPFSGVCHPLPQCKVWLVLVRNITVAMFLLKRF